MATPTSWWLTLSLMAGVNVAIWSWTALALMRARGSTDPEEYALRRRQLFLAALFTFGCAFRSIVPRADVQRICFIDSWVSAVALGRSVATVAELAMAAQWALLLREVAAGPHARLVVTLSRLILPLIAFAEVCSWFAVLTTNYLGNAFEESTWALVSALIIAGLALSWSGHRGRLRRFTSVAIFFNVAYFAFMCLVDVPMYVSRWRADEAIGRTYLSLAGGWHDAVHRWVTTRAAQDWRDEMPWMSLYFTVGVWLSIALVRAPYRSDRVTSAASALDRPLGSAAAIGR